MSLLAIDLIKTPAGQWRVINESVQRPTGTGFALENRIIISQLLSQIFHQNSVMRLAPFFIEFQKFLSRAAFHHTDDPEIVILSPGPSSETYFEQAFLSRYFGYPLVESTDLTVRDNKVFTKTLSGLEQTDVLLRWISDTDCDPLALNSHTNNGIAGVIHAMRHKNTAMVNPVGSGAIESKIFSTLYDTLCPGVLKEDLILKDLPILWCKDPQTLSDVTVEPDRFYLRSSFGEGPCRWFDPGQLGPDDKNRLIEQIRFAPYGFFARPKTSTATVPSVAPDGSILEKNFICRFFVAATDDGYQVMPGGLSSVFINNADLFTRSREGISKDIWVLSDQPVEQLSIAGRLDKAVRIRRNKDLPSRVADNFLWLGRYLEDAENQVRLYRSIFQRLSGEMPYNRMPELPVLFRIAADKRILSLESLHKPDIDGPDLHAMQCELLQAVFDPQRPLSLSALLTQVHQTATKVRDRLSQDSWRVLSRLDPVLENPHAAQWIQISDTFDVLSDLLVSLSALSGLATENMTRGPGWRFLDIGKRISRSLSLVSTIQSAVVASVDDESTMLEALLEIEDSAMTYLHRYRTHFQVAPAMDLLLSDDVNPRSLAFQVKILSEHVDTLPRNDDRKFSSPEEKILLRLMTEIRLADIQNICMTDETGKRGRLEKLMETIELGIRDFTQLVTQTYLSRIPTTQHFTSVRSGGYR